MKLFFSLFVFCFGITPSISLAADYVITPLILEHNIEPRDNFEETIKITNTTSRPLRLFPTVNAISLGENNEIQTFIPASMGDTTTSVTSWLEITRARLELAPGETIKVPLTVKVNPNVEPGEYYAFIGFAEGSKRDEAEAKVLQGTAPGTIVRLSLVEKRSEYLRLERFAVDRFITHVGNEEVVYALENVGGLPVKPTGEIIFYNGSGVELAAISVNQDQKTIAPGSIETFTQTLPPLGVIGRHKAFLNIEYGTSERANVYDTVYFNILPLRFLVSAFVLLLTVAIALAYYYHQTRLRYFDHDEAVAVYVRQGITGVKKDHDINLKSE
jgi:hypothetical protein